MLLGLPLSRPGPAALVVVTALALTATSWSGLACRRTAGSAPSSAPVCSLSAQRPRARRESAWSRWGVRDVVPDEAHRTRWDSSH